MPSTVHVWPRPAKKPLTAAMSSIDLSAHGITVKEFIRNASPSHLYEDAVRYDARTRIAGSGALVAYSGDKTGRSQHSQVIADA